MIIQLFLFVVSLKLNLSLFMFAGQSALCEDIAKWSKSENNNPANKLLVCNRKRKLKLHVHLGWFDKTCWISRIWIHRGATIRLLETQNIQHSTACKFYWHPELSQLSWTPWMNSNFRLHMMLLLHSSSRFYFKLLV